MTTITIINNLNDYKYLDYENILINESDYKPGEYCLFFSYLDNNTKYQRRILKINNDLNLRILNNNNDEGSGIINILKLKQIDNDSTINLAGISIYQGNANFYIIPNQLNIKIETEIYSFNLINGNYKINENTTKHLDITVTNQRQRDEYDKNYSESDLVGSGDLIPPCGQVVNSAERTSPNNRIPFSASVIVLPDEPTSTRNALCVAC